MADITIRELETTTQASDSSYIPIDNGTKTQKITVANYNANANATAKHYAEVAEGYAGDAATSEVNAETDALKAEGYATGKQNGEEQSSGTYYQNNAKYYKEQASLSAVNASTYANNASNSANAAAASASTATAQAQTVSEYIDQCNESAEDSEAWAVGQRGGVDVGPEDPAFQNNAKYYAEEAEAIVGLHEFVGATETTSGHKGLVPAPAAGQQNDVLLGGGSWGSLAAEKTSYDNTTSGLVANDVQAAIDEIDGNVGSLEQNLSDEVTARENADTTEVANRNLAIQTAISTEVTNRNLAIQSAVSDETSARTSADAAINTRIDEIIAPSGGAPSAAEVTDARIGANGTIYNTLGTAIRTQVTNLKIADGNLYNGNILPARYESGYGYSSRGITYTVNEDNSVTVNGTATQNSYYYFIDTSAPIKAGTYKLRVFRTSTDGKIAVQLKTADNSIAIYSTNAEEITFVVSQDTQYRAWIVVLSGKTVSNYTAYPELFKVDGDVYTPSNQSGIPALNQNVDKIHEEVNNLFPITYRAGVKTHKGVTFTVNPDYSVLVNGTNDGSGSSDFDVVLYKDNQELKKGKYRLTGLPSTGSGVGLYLVTPNSGSITVTNKEGKVKEFSSDTAFALQIYVTTGATVQNVVVKPVLEVLSDGNEQSRSLYNLESRIIATENLVRENIFPGNYYNKSGYNRNGITFTVNDDGSITANGTNNGTASYFAITDPSEHKTLKAGSYVLSGMDPQYKNVAYLFVGTLDDIGSFQLTEEKYVAGTLPADSEYRAYFVVRSGATVSNLTVYPMFEHGFIPHEYKQGIVVEESPVLVSVGGELSNKIKNIINLIRSEWTTENEIRYRPTSDPTSVSVLAEDRTFQGIPYSSAFPIGGDVFYQRNLVTFFSAVKNPASILYQDPLTYGSLRGPNYGAVCTSLTGWLSGWKMYSAAGELPYRGFKYYRYDGPESIEIGDCLLSSDHCIMVYDKIVDQATYKTMYICTIEQTSPWCKLGMRTVAEIEALLKENGGRYDLGRYPEFNIVDVPPIRYATDVIPEMGDKTYFRVDEDIHVYIEDENVTTLYYRKESDANYSEADISELTTKVVNDITMYNISALIDEPGIWYVTTDTDNKTPCTVMRIDTGSISESNSVITLSGYSEWLEPVWFQVCSLEEVSDPQPDSGYPHPEGYRANIVQRAYIPDDVFTFSKPSQSASCAGWYIRINYETGFGQCVVDSPFAIYE